MQQSQVKPKLTTEYLRSLFKNNFDLTNYAIRLSRFYVHAGREVDLSMLLQEVYKHPNETYLDVLEEMEKEEEPAEDYNEG